MKIQAWASFEMLVMLRFALVVGNIQQVSVRERERERERDRGTDLERDSSKQ